MNVLNLKSVSSESMTNLLPGLSSVGELKRLGHLLANLLRPKKGLYEVLDYETILEILDTRGKDAQIRKVEKVRYLQDNIIAFQDQAWGDGKYLENYQCNPGIPVDKYRLGYKALILISLRKVKSKGILDTFNIQWRIKNGFLKKTGFWSTEVSHRTNKIEIKVIFPKSRPPLCAFIIERNHQKTFTLGEKAKTQLADGRWMLSWSKKKPHQFEQYILNWEW